MKGKGWLSKRLYERAALLAVRKARTLVLLWARQCRKSTALAVIAFDEMSRGPHRNVIAASASLLVGSELVGKSVSTVEQAAVVLREAGAFQAAFVASLGASKTGLRLVAANRRTSAEYRSLSAEAFTDLYRAGRLELRLYHDRSAYSRLQVIAPNPATARGWTGTVLRDEAAFTPAAVEAQLQEAVGPIIDADPSFRLVWATFTRAASTTITTPCPPMSITRRITGLSSRTKGLICASLDRTGCTATRSTAASWLIGRSAAPLGRSLIRGQSASAAGGSRHPGNCRSSRAGGHRGPAGQGLGVEGLAWLAGHGLEDESRFERCGLFLAAKPRALPMGWYG
jgi:hypothetical protein